MASDTVIRGLAGVVAAESRICKIDGLEGKLYYRGYSVQELDAHSNFEEVTYLLLYGELPTSDQITAFSKKMRDSRGLSEPILDMIRSFPKDSHPMELLQSVIAYLSGYVKHRIQHSATCDCRNTLHQIVQIASVLATFARVRKGEDYIPPRMDLSHGANFLYMLHGTEPDPLDGEIMDKILILHAEHGFNPSTFTARVVASTLSTCYCCVASAIGSLYGSLHGGANEAVVGMVDEIGDKENVESWVDEAMAKKRKIMGMGHRVYKVKDPRAIIIERYLTDLSDRKKDHHHLELLKELERVSRDRMETAGKPIYPNVDFFAGSVYSLLGIEPIFFTPMFAMSRVVGWLAHILEQRSDNRLFRPKALYVGPEPREYIPLENR